MKQEYKDFRNVCFLPIDLPYQKINLDELEVFHDRNYMWPPDVVTESYSADKLENAPYVETAPHELWRIVCILGQIDEEDFGKADKVRESWLNRLTRKRKVNVNPALPKELYGIVKLIEQLPIQCNHAELIRQRRDVPLHMDVPGLSQSDHSTLRPLEPSGYRLLINDVRDPSLFWTESLEQQDPEDYKFMELPMDTNTFVLNELDRPHGAKKIEQQKFVVTTTGSIDPDKHLETLTRSWEKYKDYAIEFGDRK